MSEYRNIKFDSLRFLAMLMIIFHHCIINDFGLQRELCSNINLLSISEIQTLGFFNSFVLIGVNIFFLLSGYFQIKFSWNKFLHIILQTFFIYGVVTFIGIITGNVTLNTDVIKNILDPIDLYWYIMTYLLLMLVSPLLNIIVEHINKDHFRLYILGILIVCGGYGFLHDVNLHINRGYSFLMAMALYLIGAGIHKFDLKGFYNKNLFVFLACGIFNSLIFCGFIVLDMRQEAWNLFAYNNPLILLESIFLLLFVKGMSNNRFEKYKWISALSKSTLTVYLLHSTCWLTKLRHIPMELLIQEFGFWIALIMLPVYAIFIYLICCVVDKLLAISIDVVLWKISKKCDILINSMFSKCLKIIK